MAAAVVAGCSGGSSNRPSTATTASTTPTAGTATAAGGLRRYDDQRLDWRDCGGGDQCASLTVPLDYARPAGRTLSLAVIRKPARGHSNGALVVNPGGPGASGVQFVRRAAGLFARLADFDLVSFDPRGIGQSHPIRCVSSAGLDAFVHADPIPTTAAQRRATVAEAKRFVAGCAERNGSFLRDVSTVDTARDMDVLRAALRQPTLTYYGASYGTYLGATYARLFPHRIRAMVLDGALDPTTSGADLTLEQARGFQADLNDFLAHCAATGSCPFTGNVPAATSGLQALIRRVAAHPLTVGSRSLGVGELYEGLGVALYSPSSWPTLQTALREAQQGNGAGMLALSDSYTNRSPDGSYDNLIESNTAIACIDRPWPSSVAAVRRLARRAARVSSVFGAAFGYSTLDCAFWPVKPATRPAPVRAAGAPPILVVGTTRDPATPYVWAQALTRQLDSARLLTLVGDGHTAYGRGDACIVSAVDGYLESLRLPAAGLVCR